MKHTTVTDELLAAAASHALGALPADEARQFESHLGDGCSVCQEAADSFARAAGCLGFATLPLTPPPALRARLFAALHTGMPSRDAMAGSPPAPGPVPTVVRAEDGAWEAAGVDGVFFKRLFRDVAVGRFIVLGRLEPGARYPSHRHADTEELFVLEGDLTVGEQTLRVGDYCAATAGTTHAGSSSIGGCRFLLTASERDEVLDQQALSSRAGVLFVRSGEGTWREWGTADVSVRRLFSNPAQEGATALVRMAAGTQLPPHSSPAGEHLYLVRGSLRLADILLQSGDYAHNPAEAFPDTILALEDSLLLLISSGLDEPAPAPA